MVFDPKLMALITAISFGAAPVVLKMAFRRGGEAGIGILISLASAIPMTLMVALVLDPHFELLTPFAVVAFILGGLAGSAVGRYWNYVSIDMLGPARSATIRSSSPVFTAFLAVLIYQEEIPPARWAAIASIVGGAALVSWSPGSGARGWLNLGVLYATGAAIAYGFRPIFIKAGLVDADVPLAASIIGAFAALVYTLLRENPRVLRAIRLDAAFGWFLVGGIVQAIAQLSLALGLAGGEVSLVYTITASSPLFTLAFTALLLRGAEEINLRLVLGSLAVVAGVAIL
jgi:drug/metabolite transporter (DMT)-like permease